jgi:hypothetical protein
VGCTTFREVVTEIIVCRYPAETVL